MEINQNLTKPKRKYKRKKQVEKLPVNYKVNDGAPENYNNNFPWRPIIIKNIPFIKIEKSTKEKPIILEY